MENRLLEAGKIIGTHGLRGEVKVLPWSDTPDFLCSMKTVYIGGRAARITGARVSKGVAVLSLEGIGSLEEAEKLRDQIVSVSREDVSLPEGRFFLQDAVGLTALDDDTGTELGKVTGILSLPSGSVLEIHGKREILVPAVPDFLLEIRPDKGFVRVHLIEGL